MYLFLYIYIFISISNNYIPYNNLFYIVGMVYYSVYKSEVVEVAVIKLNDYVVEYNRLLRVQKLNWFCKVS